MKKERVYVSLCACVWYKEEREKRREIEKRRRFFVQSVIIL